MAKATRKIKFTHRGIGSLSTDGPWLTDYWDESLPGFGVRVHHTGRKAYFVRYQGENGKRRRLTVGKYPTMSLADARDKAKEVIGRIAAGADPQAKRQADREAETFGDLAAEYLERHAKLKKRSWKEDERVIGSELLPAWKNRKATKVTRRDISDLLDGVVERGAQAAGIESFTSHDLRRTAASHMTSMGIPRLVVSKVLNHAESGITAVYDRHSYDAEKRQALVRWAGRLDEILGEVCRVPIAPESLTNEGARR